MKFFATLYRFIGNPQFLIGNDIFKSIFTLHSHFAFPK